MRRGLLAVAIALSVAAAFAPVGSSRAEKFVKFRMPSKNIACAYFSGGFGHKPSLRCDVLSGLNPAPRKRCELDWVGVEMTRRGKAHALCAGDTVYDKNAPILKYGTKWKHGGFRCRSKRIGLKCRNRGGHGFFLSRERWRVY